MNSTQIRIRNGIHNYNIIVTDGKRHGVVVRANPDEISVGDVLDFVHSNLDSTRADYQVFSDFKVERIMYRGRA